MTKKQKQFRGEKRVFSTNDAGAKTKYRYRTYNLFLKKNNSKWVIDLNVKCKAIEDNKGEYLGDVGLGW